MRSMLENNPESRANENDILLRLFPNSKGMTEKINAILQLLLPQR
jgi:hypothetical protein